MLYFILENNHKIDLTHKRVTFIEKNPWFETDFNSEYSFPFEMHADEFVKITDFANYNSSGAKTQFKGKLYRDGQLTDATLKIQQQKGKVISGIIFSGLEAFPNFNKQLKDLPLDNFPVSDLKQHALVTITKNYPETSHNFGMIHTDKYDSTSDEFNGFEKIINNYSEGNFHNNILQANTNVDLIRNIIQPMPYLMHVVEKGFEAAGYLLEGDILGIEDFKKALIIRDGEYYTSVARDSIPFRLKTNEWLNVASIVAGREQVYYMKQLTIEKKGDYIIQGFIYSFIRMSVFSIISDLQIHLSYTRNGVTTIFYFYEKLHTSDLPVNHNYVVSNHEIDIPFSFEVGDVINFWKVESRRDVVPNPMPDYPEACSLEILPIRYRNPDGTPIVSLLDLKEVDLKRVVPDMSFGDLIGVLQKWKNLDFTIDKNVVKMNFIQPQLNRSVAHNLEEFEIEEPLRTFSDERSYELSFTDGKTHETYKYDSVFITRDSTIINEYRTNNNTKEIPIDALPYPVINRNSVTTAFNFDNENNKLRLAFFKSVIDGSKPVCYENLEMMIPQIYANNYKQWFKFLVNSVAYQWDFIISVEKFKDILINSLVFCYGNYHIFSETEKERLNHLYLRVSAKSESLV